MLDRFKGRDDRNLNDRNLNDRDLTNAQSRTGRP